MYSGNIEEQTHAASDVYNQPPSYKAMAHGQGESLSTVTYRGLDPAVGPVNSTEAPPSFTALGHVDGKSYNHDVNFNRDQLGGNSYGYGAASRPPLSIGAMARGGVSQTSEVVDPNYAHDKAPNLSDVNRREASQTGASTVVVDGPEAEELVGFSLVGNNFRRLYPNAYYKEKDDGEN